MGSAARPFPATVRLSVPSWGLAVAVALALAALGAAGSLVERYVVVPTSRAAMPDWDGGAQTSLFGEFRTTLSDYLLLKADRTHHRGVMIRHLTQKELAKAGPYVSGDP